MSSSRCSAGQTAGFTLTEILLVVAILGTISAMVFGAFQSTIQVVERVREEQGWGSLTRATLQFMADELSAGHRSPSAPWIGQSHQQNGQPADTLAFLSTAQVRSGANARETEISRVVYTREGSRLVRVARRNQFGLTDESIEQIELLDSVIGFKVRYYDATAQTWIDQWDGRTRGSLPRVVMIELTLQRQTRQPETFIQWITIPTLSS